MEDYMKVFTIQLKQGQVYSSYSTDPKALFKAVLDMYEPGYNPNWGYTEVTINKN